MTTREKELIAIGVSYAVNCDPCIRYHWQVGKEAGVTIDEAQEAIKIAEMVNRGAKLRMLDIVEETLGQSVKFDNVEAPAGCGCPEEEAGPTEPCGC